MFGQALNDLSLLIVMLDKGDRPGQELALDLCSTIASEAENLDIKEAIESSFRRAKGAFDSSEFPEFTAALTELVSAARGVTSATGNVLSSASSSVGWGDDLSPHADDELIVEVIEKYSSSLEELEATLMSCSNQGVDVSEIERYTKSYLHSLKGDAGSVGLLGIERVTHRVEDIFTKNKLPSLVEPFLRYAAWVRGCLRSYADGSVPSELSGKFMEQLEQSMCTGSSDAPAKDISAVSVASESYKISGDADILVDFIAESEEHLNAIEGILLDREDGYDKEEIDAIFRATHSIKGSSAYFNLLEMTQTSHIAENMLDQVREGRLPFSQEIKSIVLYYIDLQRVLLGRAKSALQGDGLISRSSGSGEIVKRIELVLSGERLPIESRNPSSAAVSTKPSANLKSEREDMAVTSAVEQESSEAGKVGEKRDIKSFVKVETNRLDKLIEYIGEMVISSSMLIRNCQDLLPDNEAVRTNTHQLDQIVREIQDIGMSMRLIPIKGLFQKMSRVVWDTAKKIGKDVVFKVEGDETELDRNLIDRLADPLMHMVRNAVDHGIEHPDDREAVGKPRAGTVRLSAFHRGGNINIEIADDGRGLDADKLIRKGIEKGIIDESKSLNEQEAFQLIFAPGFSTASVVTDVSGRGVGMDVVKRNIESMRGRVHIQSKSGEGSVFRIELPLTLAIMEGIETVVVDRRFIIPTLAVIEFVKPTESMIHRTLDAGEMLNFRGSYLPIIRLQRVFGIEGAERSLSESILAVVESNGELVTLVLDDIVGKMSAVVKNLGDMFKGTKGLTGCAIMPNGAIGLILDIPTLLSLARSEKIYSIPSLPAAPLKESDLATLH